MRSVTESICPIAHDVLFSIDGEDVVPGWVRDVGQVLRPAGMTLTCVASRGGSLDRVRLGGLAAAVVVAERRAYDGLSLLRTIRSISVELPCWLVTEAPSRVTLQTAMGLRGVGVVSSPVDADALAAALRRLTMN